MTERLEPFRQALTDLRRRLRDGRLQPGARVTAREVADDLKLSHTPVREALSRMAGEGLLEERRGDGFFVPELSAADIAVLLRLSEDLLLFSQEAARPDYRAARVPDDLLRGEPARAVEHLFLAWVSEAGSRVAVEVFRTVALRLSAARRREGELIGDLAAEADGLLRLADPSRQLARPAAIQAFYERRVGLSDRLAGLLARPLADPDG